MSGMLEDNLGALSVLYPGLAERIRSSAPSPEIDFMKAASGAPVPRLLQHGGRPAALHSTVDPETEGKRIGEELRGAGFMIFVGMGAGYHILPFLEDASISGILIVEKAPEFARSIFSNIDLSGLLRDPRVRLLIDPRPGDVEAAVTSLYLPSLMGGMKTFSLRAMKYPAAYISSISAEISSAADMIRADYAAQARFGKRWVHNIFANLPFIRPGTFKYAGKDKVMIAAAGPSLDLQIPLIRGRDGSTLLLSTDTALPALIGRGIIPDCAVSIDCQHYGYHHALSSRTGGVNRIKMPFLFGFSSPPSLVRAAGERFFFADGHPLSLYASRHWAGLPELDTSGGNVAYAAFGAACSFGARSVTFCGLDYSYPDGKPYARGTYIPALFHSGSRRFEPAETRFASLVFGADTSRRPIGAGWLYTKPLLDSYHASMSRLMAEAGVEVVVAPGRGLPFALPTGLRANRPRPWTESRPQSGWRDFLAAYRDSVAALPSPVSPPGPWLRSLPEREREVWITLLPLVPCLEAEKKAGEDSARLLLMAREWILPRADRMLRS